MNQVADKVDLHIPLTMAPDGVPVNQQLVPTPTTSQALVVRPKMEVATNGKIISGPFKGLQSRYVDALGLSKKDWVGIKPVELADNVATFGRGLASAAMRALLSVFYKVKVDNQAGALNAVHGALVLVSPHTGLDDPPTVYSHLWPMLHATAVATEATLSAPIVKSAMKYVNTLPVPDVVNPIGSDDEMSLLIAQICSGLDNGRNIGAHIAGEIVRDELEAIGSNSLVQRVLALRPETQLLVVTPRGLNGSPFSRAGNNNKAPTFEPAVAMLKTAVHNILRLRRPAFMRRPVTLEIRDMTAQLKAQATVPAQNKLIEDIANTADPKTGTPNPAWFIPLTKEDGPARLLTPVTRARAEATVEVSPETIAEVTATVQERLAGLTGMPAADITPDRKLSDLGLDSIKIADKVLVWVNSTFGRQFATPEAFITVGDVIGAASGQILATAGLELSEPSVKYIEQAKQDGPLSIPPGSRNVVDGFLKSVKAEPDRLVGFDETLGEVTNKTLAMLAYMLVPEMQKLEGDRIGLLFPNSVLGTAVQLALNLAGKKPAMLNPEWDDAKALNSMDIAGVKNIVTAQAVIRALKGKRQLQDIAAVEHGVKTQETVEADPTRTAYPSLESRFVAIDDTMRSLSEFRTIGALLRPGHVMRFLEKRAAALKPKDDAVTLYTSGSTGNPTGIAYRHESVLAGAQALAKHFNLRRSDILLHMAPSFHLVGYTAGMMGTLMGIPEVNVPNPKAAAVAAETARLRQATIAVATPTLMNVVANTGGAGAFPSLRLVILGAEPLKEEVANNIRRAAPNAQILQGYGATETGVLIAEQHEPVDPKDRTLGQPLEGVELVIVDPDDYSKVAAPGANGVLLARGPQVVTPEHGFIAGKHDDAFQEINGKVYYVTKDIVRAKQVAYTDGVTREAIEYVGRDSRFTKINGVKISHDTIDEDLSTVLPATVDGTPKSFTVEGPEKDGTPTLVAYVVPGKGPNGTAVDASGAQLSCDTLNKALLARHDGDAKYALTEIRIVPNIQMLGTGKIDLGFYRKGAKADFDGPTLKRGDSVTKS